MNPKHVTFNYQAEAEQTNSPHYHATKVPALHFESVIDHCVRNLENLDAIKKAVFYGRDLPQHTLDLFSFESKVDQMFEPSSKAMTVPLVHSIIGIATEAGELLECFDKPEFDRTNFIEEIGDVLWYIAIGLNAVNSTFEEAQRINIAKLRKRYPEKFTEYDANNRDLKAEREVLEQGGFVHIDRMREGSQAFHAGKTPSHIPQGMSHDEKKAWLQGFQDAAELELLKISAAEQRETMSPKSRAMSGIEDAATRLINAKHDGQGAHRNGFSRSATWATFELRSLNETKEWLRGWDEAERQSAIHMRGIDAGRKHPGGIISHPPFAGREEGPEIHEFAGAKPIDEVNKSFEIDGHRLNFQQAQTYIALKQTQKLGELLDSYQLPL